MLQKEIAERGWERAYTKSRGRHRRHQPPTVPQAAREWESGDLL